ncbi:MAG: phospholipase, partial [Boseongicola sp.]|nr:phospholipase [Boseongicola sp.]
MLKSMFRMLGALAATAMVTVAWAETAELPTRQSPIPETTNGVPHIQIGVAPVPEISEELLNRVSSLSGVEIRPTIVSLPGALGFWVAEDFQLTRPDVIV